MQQRNDQDMAFDATIFDLVSGHYYRRYGNQYRAQPVCEFTFDYRNLPHMDESQVIEPIRAFIKTLEPKMHAIDSDTGIELTRNENVPCDDR